MGLYWTFRSFCPRTAVTTNVTSGLYASLGQIYFSRILFPMQSDEPITLSDSAFSRYRDIRCDFLFIREITYQWIFAKITNKSNRIISHWEIKCHRLISFLSYSALFSEISLLEIFLSIFLSIFVKTNE